MLSTHKMYILTVITLHLPNVLRFSKYSHKIDHILFQVTQEGSSNYLILQIRIQAQAGFWCAKVTG